jgi:GT2 family glycosyltransferase
VTLSIVIVNFRGWKRLQACLESLKQLKQATFSWEVVIVDNCSGDGLLSLFEKEFSDFKFITNSGNNGFANGCNIGAQQSTGEFIFFLNPDTTSNLHALEQLLKVAQNHPEIILLTCTQLTKKGRNTKPYGLFFRPATMTSLLRSIYRLTHKYPKETQLKSGEKVILPEWISGSAVFIKRTEFNNLGGWCEDYWMYYEDADLCKRARTAGGQIALLTDVNIIHNHGGASRVNSNTKALTKSEVLISRHVYVNKHFHGPTRLILQTYLIIDNLIISYLFMGIVGLLLFFIPSVRTYAKLYRNIIYYYLHAIKHKTWLSSRSVSYQMMNR